MKYNLKNHMNERLQKIMEYGKTAYNRTVYASPPVGGSGYEKPQSG
jgi:hypothetical protein